LSQLKLINVMPLVSSELSIPAWTARAKTHTALVSPMADAFLERRKLGKTHAVHDFLFTYYRCSPNKLKQWVPSINETLVFDSSMREKYPWLDDYWFSLHGNSLALNKARFHKNIRGLSQFVAEMCANILQQPPRFGCFGLHEWAMVYKLPSEDLRHKGQRLRMSPDNVAQFVESQAICCSHYDAFRFFTQEARPLNLLNPILETRLQMEQGGCVHANMDLYKWSVKLWPWVGSDFIAKTFFLALEGRELDMRASPYDLLDEGYPPICIETEEGRKLYQKEQQQLTERATPLREELRLFCERLALLSP
jgi:hypothetical protein